MTKRIDQARGPGPNKSIFGMRQIVMHARMTAKQCPTSDKVTKPFPKGANTRLPELHGSPGTILCVSQAAHPKQITPMPQCQDHDWALREEWSFLFVRWLPSIVAIRGTVGGDSRNLQCWPVPAGSWHELQTHFNLRSTNITTDKQIYQKQTHSIQQAGGQKAQDSR